MATRRRRQGSRGTWLPPLPTFLGEETTGYSWYESVASIPAGAGGESLTFVPLLADSTPNVDASQGGLNHTMRDLVEGQEYTLKRAVGKVWAAPEQSSGQGQLERILVCMALAVLPVDDASPSAPALDGADFDPLLSQNAMAPYLWRRTWVLSNLENPDIQFKFPESTAYYGSVADGGHLDTKGTARRIRREQRLFFLLSAINLTDTEFPGNLLFGYDLRFFGAMRRARGQSTFK